MHDVANGGPLVEVPTESGPVPSIQKWFAALNDRTSGAVGQVQQALDDEVLARQQLGERVDSAVLSYPDYAAASAAAATLADGQRLCVDENGLTYVVKSGALVLLQTTQGFINVQAFGAKGDGATDDYIAISAADAAARVLGRKLYFPATGGNAYRSSKYLVATVDWFGDGPEDYWDGEKKGTIISPLGAGFPARWTDIDGADAADDTPFIVIGRSEIGISGMTVHAPADAAWEYGVFLPGTRRNKFSELNTTGAWSKAGVYGAATWSDQNTTLTALHPEVVSSGGMNEISFYKCFLTGLWGLKFEGTTRDISTTPWVWAPGGTSDLDLVNCRLGSSTAIDAAIRANDGGAYYHSVKVPNTAGAGQGHNFVSCTFRVASKYVFSLDYSNRDTFTACYGETISSWRSTYGESIIAITSNTNNCIRIADLIGGRVFLDGVEVSTGGLDFESAQVGNRMAVQGAAGFFAAPWGRLPVGTRPMKLNQRSGQSLSIGFYPSSGVVTEALLIGETAIRPAVSGGVSLGTTSFPFNVANVTALRAIAEIRPTADNTIPCGGASYRFTQVYAASGTINTSDGRDKTDPVAVQDALLDAWGEVHVLAWKWLESVAKKGGDARLHTGPVAQHIRDALVRHGLMDEGSTSSPWAGLCYDEWGDEFEPVISIRKLEDKDEPGHYFDEEYETGEMRLVRHAGDRWGIRADQCHFLEAAYQRRRADRIEARLTAIEAKL